MATTDTRTGFRLPWSSDRNQETSATDEAAPPAAETTGDTAPDSQIARPSNGTGPSVEPTPDSRAAEPSDAIAPTVAQESAMIDLAQPPAPAPAAPRKPSKLMVDLGAAIRATAESARDQALAQVDADVAHVIEAIRSGSKEGEAVLRVRSDEDVAKIREWSRSEIARIKEETESRIGARKLNLDGELAAHAAAIEGRVGQVEGTAAAYRASMASYADSLGSEDDPSRLATLAESMPEPPELEAWADLTDLALVIEPVEVPQAAPAETEDGASVTPETEPVADLAEAVDPAEAADADEASDSDEIPFENIVAALGGDLGMPDSPAAAEATETEATETVATEPVATEPVARPSWGESPELTMSGTPATGEMGEPIDRGALLAALEAAAEAVVAAESAAESADQAEAAADAANAAAGLVKGRADTAEEADDPAAMAAMSARMDAGGLEESFADRLASLMPGHGEGSADGAPRTTQVIVSGLVSVASIASFKRHLGRLAGVQSVAVASGPDGEFVFNVTHRPDVSFRDAVPTMPGFAARVTTNADGVVHVTARDPEAEG